MIFVNETWGGRKVATKRGKAEECKQGGFTVISYSYFVLTIK